MVHWPKRALVPDREVVQGVRGPGSSVCAGGRFVYGIGCRWADISKLFSLPNGPTHAVRTYNLRRLAL